MGKVEHQGSLKPRDLKPCGLCGKGLMHAHAVVFYKVTVQQFVIDMNAVRELAGMELMLGKAAPLAEILGSVNEIAFAPVPASAMLVCLECATMQPTSVAAVIERCNEAEGTGE